jgi:hypothetical protein
VLRRIATVDVISPLLNHNAEVEQCSKIEQFVFDQSTRHRDGH